MANVSLRGTSNLINVLPKRLASASAASQPQQARSGAVALSKEPFRVTKLDNGVVVASLENHSPVTRIAAVVNAGPRDELSSQRGASHALRVYSNLATRNYSAFGLTRNLNQFGAELSVTNSREQTTYLLESTRKYAGRGVDILGEIVTRPEFRHWEMNDARPRLHFELEVFDEKPELQLVELLHKASFAGGLDNSLYAPHYNADSLDSDALLEFRRRTFTANNLSLVGVGIPHNDLVRYAEFFRLPQAPADFTRQKSRFIRGELRQDDSSDIVHVAIATEGVSLSSKDSLAAALTQHALGTSGQRIKYSNSNKLARVLLPLASEPAAISAFNASYSDTGLFGYHLVANKADVGKLTRGLAKELANLAKNGLNEKELEAARNSLKVAISERIDNSHGLIEAVGLNAEQAQSRSNLSEQFKAVDALSANDVNAFVKRVAGGKLSLAAIGDLSELPRLEELQ